MNLSHHTTELLNFEKILSAIEDNHRNLLSSLEIFDAIDSTNSYLLTKAKEGAPSGGVCFAEQQTHGRGRCGKSWFSPYGTNIYCSLLWRFDQYADLSGLSIAVGVMIVNVLKKYGIKNGLELKWPNDILFLQHKLGGILLECNNNAVIIGIGLNLSLPSVVKHENWIAIQDITGKTPARNYLAGLLVNELLAKLLLYQSQGLHAFLADWQQYDVLKNKSVMIHTPNAQYCGIMRGINEKGEILLQQDNGSVQCFCYGEVSVKIPHEVPVITKPA